MKFSEFLGKRVPTNFFVGKNSKLIMNVSYPGDMIHLEDQIVIDKLTDITDISAENPEEFIKDKKNKEEIFKYLKNKFPIEFDGVLIIKNPDCYEFRFFIQNKEETEYSLLYKEFEKLNTDFKIKKTDIEFISGDMDCRELIDSLRKEISEKMRKAEEKRNRKMKI